MNVKRKLNLQKMICCAINCGLNKIKKRFMRRVKILAFAILLEKIQHETDMQNAGFQNSRDILHNQQQYDWKHTLLEGAESVVNTATGGLFGLAGSAVTSYGNYKTTQAHDAAAQAMESQQLQSNQQIAAAHDASDRSIAQGHDATNIAIAAGQNATQAKIAQGHDETNMSIAAGQDATNRSIAEGLYRDWETDRKSTRLNSSH